MRINLKISKEELKKKLDLKDGEDGLTPTNEELRDLIEPLIPEPIKPEIPEQKELKAEEIRDLLSTLKGKERLDAKHIKNLPKGDGKIPILYGGGSNIKVRDRYDLSDQLDGATKTFTLPLHVPNTVSLFGTQFPKIYRPVIDYNDDDQEIITLTDEVGAPQFEQTLIAEFQRAE